MEERVQELEIRITLQQDLLQQLSEVVARHDQEVARLRAQVEELRGLRAAAQLPLIDEKPPHY
jgi:SlyX protein